MWRVTGFTYIELLVTMVIMGLISIAVLPRAPGLGVEAGPEVEQLAADLRYVQMRSMNDGARFCLSVSANSYSLSTAASGCTVPLVSAGGIMSPVTLRDAQLVTSGLPGTVIVFDGMGTPYGSAAPSAVALTSAIVFTLTVAGVTRSVTVSPVTGMVVASP